MRHVTLAVSGDNAPLAALLLARYGVFSPERGALGADRIPDAAEQRYRDVYLRARRKLEEICRHCRGRPPPPEDSSEVPSLRQLEELDRWLGELLEIAHTCETARDKLHLEHERDQSLLAGLEPFRKLDVDLGLLRRPQRLLDVRVGSVPEARASDLRLALEGMGALIDVVGVWRGRAMAILILPSEVEAGLTDLLDAHGWEERELPPEYAAKPPEVEARIRGREAELAEQAKGFFFRHEASCGHMRARLVEARHMLAAAEPYAMLVADLLPGQEGRRAVSGWILAANEGLLRRRLEEKVPGRYELQVRAPYPSERESVPSALRYPDWLGPFAELVRNYGTPCYGQFDPTLLFAVTFMLMFGMMFGDVGHGLVIAAAGFVLRGRARRFRALLLGAGVASAVFGVFYGSVFGMHDVFTPVWLCPVHHPMRMLQVAVGWGVGFMALSQLITIYNRLAARNMKAALLDVGGLAGGLLYLGGVVGAYEFVTAGRIGGPALAACGAGIAGILAYQWGEQSGRGAERAVTTLFSGLEAVLLYLTNTLSFIRIAAFSISHAAMALAIFMLAEQMGSKTGRWLTLVIGNLIVLTLEGAVVAIQVLRLEYYEGFSRFFTCVGREFKPIGREEREAASTAPPPDAERIDRLLPEHWQQERRFTRPPP